MKNISTALYHIWLTEALGGNYKAYRELVDTFGSAYEAYAADDSSYSYLSSNCKRHVTELCDKRLDKAQRISDYCADNKINVLTCDDAAFPSLLKNIEDPPIVLYVKGKMPRFDDRLCVSVVGTRKMTEYGKEVAYDLGYSLAKNGVIVVSGMALGNDSVAMCAALDAGGDTVGILGSGVDIAYPTQHARFMKELSSSGTLISEYPPGSRAEPKNFPRRNRLISGISRACIVVECDKGSGALITAKHAQAQGRGVFAVPGKVGEASSFGTLGLISDGAGIAINANDVIKNYAFIYGGSVDMKSYERISSEQIDARLIKRQVYIGNAACTSASDKTMAKDSTQARDKKKKEGILGTLIKKKASDTERTKNENASHTETGVSSAQLQKLSPKVRAIYDKLPKDEIFSADDLSRYDVSAKDFMSAMTMLEIYSLAQSYPGGRYLVKK